MAEAKLTPELIPEGISSLDYTPNALDELLFASQTGLMRNGTPLTEEQTQLLNGVRAEWNRGEGQSFGDVAAQIYPQGVAQNTSAGLNSVASWYKSGGTRQRTVYTEPLPLNLDGMMEVSRELADIGLGVGETGLTVATGLLDMGKSAVDFSAELYQSRNSSQSLTQRLVDAKQKSADAPNWTYQPKTLAGEGITTILFSPIMELNKIAEAAGEKVGEVTGGVNTPDGEVPSDLEMARMKDLYDLSVAAQQSGDASLMPNLLRDEYKSLQQRFEGAINSEGEYIEINYPQLFAQYGTRELINLIPDLAAFGPGAFARRNGQQRQRERLTAIGINPFDPVNNTILNNYETAANRISGGQKNKAENMALVQQGLIDAQSDRKRETRRLYDVAEEAGDASVAVQYIADFNSNLYDLFNPSTSTFDISSMPYLQSTLNQFRVLAEGTPASRNTGQASRLGKNVLTQDFMPATPPAPSQTIRQLSNFRRDINRRIGNSADPSEQAALAIVKSKLDNSMDSWFENNLMSGDATALGKWREASEHRRLYAVNFDEKAVIRRIVENDLTQNEIKKLLLGLSEFNMPAQAARIVNEIKATNPANLNEIMSALQNDIKFDVMQPLLEAVDTGKVDLGGFLNRYNKVFGKRGDKELLTALFPDGFDDITTLRDHALAAQRAIGLKPSAIEGPLKDQLGGRQTDTSAGVPFFDRAGVANSLAVIALGHSLARSQLKVNFGRNILRRFMGGGGSSNVQKRILEEMTGQPWATRIPLTTLKEMPQFRAGAEAYKASANSGRIDWGAGGGLTSEQMQHFENQGYQLIQPPNAPNSYALGGLIGIPVKSQEEKDLEEMQATQERVRKREFDELVNESFKTITYPNGRPIRDRRTRRRMAIRQATEQMEMSEQ